MTSADSPRSFVSTRWSLIAAAGQTSPKSREALETLCSIYWPPLYTYVRRRGYQPAEAQDLTQAFFVALLEKERLQLADPGRGRFRSFLLASMNHFLANTWRSANAQKRGGGTKAWSLDFTASESAYGQLAEQTLTAEQMYERRWAMTLLENSLAAVRGEYVAAGKEALFDALKAHLGGEPDKSRYAEISETLGMTVGAVKVAAHRLRNRCRDVLRHDVAQTVADPDEIDEELQQLFRVLAQ